MPVEAKPLFRPDVLRPHLVSFRLPARVDDAGPMLASWAELLASPRADKLKEQELLPDFLTDIFGALLGYTGPARGGRGYTISREKHVEVDGKFADAVLGRFGGKDDEFIVALEGKGPRDPLDRPFGGRRLSAVEQGYRYAINLPCDWIIVTSIRQTRLYHKGSDYYTYERFDTLRLSEDEALLKRFVFLLGAERVVPETGPCHLFELLNTSEKVGRELTKDYYIRYADIRHVAFERLSHENPEVSRHDVLAGTQKLLDRVLFCAFCENRGLLPEDTLRQAFEHRDPYHPRPVWENFCGLFHSINRGNDTLKIPAYNGGLFADDPLLERMNVPDDVCGFFRDLGDYDYRPSHQVVAETETDTAARVIDVDILGHIFEQSITDLERLRNELDGLAEPVGLEKHKTRRKKEGAFYTPAFITRYIIEQALGRVLQDRFEELRSRHQQAAKATARTALADPSVYDLEKLNNPQRGALVKFWEAWQDELATVRILDPACGSGAFLIEAFDQLHTAYGASNDRLEELRGHRTLFDLDRQILQNNLYGVDLNEEAIEICRLSLWIKTAQRGKILTSLDHTIRVGNSVVSDPSVHEKALDWQGAFPEVFESGGFDVVVGNPPYIRQEWLAPYKAFWRKHFKGYHGTADIFAYFYELGVNLLRDGGRLGFITSGSWVRANFGAPLRKFLSENAKIESMIDFGEFQPFEGAEMIRPSIAILQKAQSGGSLRIFKWLTKGTPPENLSELIVGAPTIRTNRLGSDAWELEPDEVVVLREKLVQQSRPLAECIGLSIYRGILTGLTDAFVLSPVEREELIAKDRRCESLIKPFAQGTHLRPWYVKQTSQFLIAIKSSANFTWPWTEAGERAEQVFADEFPAIHTHLSQFKTRAVKRQDQGEFWWELRSCSYWEVFDQPKIVWPDISKLPRFSMDTQPYCLGNTAYTIPTDDYFVLGVLSSWATWFFISKTAQPLRLRGDRWQYRLFTQFMGRIPIPGGNDADKNAVAELAKRCGELAQERHGLHEKVRHRLLTTFGEEADGTTKGKLNQKAQAWWELSLGGLGAALKTSFKLPASPFKNPRTADQWEPYLAEHKADVETLSHCLSDAEAELNDRVYRLFNLTPDEIKLLQREVEH